MARGGAGGRGGRGVRIATVEENYGWDDVVREARTEEGIQQLEVLIGAVMQRLDALEVAYQPRRHPFHPNALEEFEGTDDECSKPFAGNRLPRGRGGEVVAHNRGSHYCESSMKIEIPKKNGLPQFHGGRKDVIEEILVEGDVGDFIDDILEEESDKIFLDTNPSLLQSEIDWDSPPKFDEYSDEEETFIHKVEENMKDEFVEVGIKLGIEKKAVVIHDKVDGMNSFDGVLNLAKKAINVCPSLGFEVSEYMDPFWRVIEEYYTSKSPWISIFEQDGLTLLTKIISLIFEDSFLQFSFQKINLKYKIDADQIRRIQLYKLEDEFLQAGENDADWKFNSITYK